MTVRVLIALAALIGLQALDVILHIATGQFEPIRILSNAVLVAGAVAGVVVTPRSTPLLVVAGGLYLALNAVFVLQHGLVNPATDALRLPLFVFVAGSLVLAAWLGRRVRAA